MTVVKTFLNRIIIIYLMILVLPDFLLADPPVFEAGVILQNENEELPGDSSGYTAPCLGDWDNDDDMDLLVGTFRDGPIYFFENISDEGEPEFELQGRLEADDQVIAAPYE